MRAKWLSPYDRNPSFAVDQPLSSPPQRQAATRASLLTTTTISQASYRSIPTLEMKKKRRKLL
ncbi:hypothetical protein KSP39_PZI020297 [Platanthera zijinensis]|uniref:Uncharacterized protein n=1 Tax=Platanthera zijinensis TaxID=2320716 RepID=A0AAP0FWT7_9ASPA